MKLEIIYSERKLKQQLFYHKIILNNSNAKLTNQVKGVCCFQSVPCMLVLALCNFVLCFISGEKYVTLYCTKSNATNYLIKLLQTVAAVRWA